MNNCFIECLEVLSNTHIIINNPLFIQVSKIDQLRLAQKIGFKTPKTFFITHHDHLLKLLNNENKYVVKSSGEIMLTMSNYKGHSVGYTSDILINKIGNKIDKIFPSYVQEKIQVDYEVRVFVFGDHIKSCAIFNNKSTTDYRKSYSEGVLNYLPYQLPIDICKKILLLNKELNIQTASIDLLKSNGCYYFLELNPSGQYNFIDVECNFGISKLIAESLCRYEEENKKES